MKPRPQPRPEQQTPDELVTRIMREIRSRYYPEAESALWFQSSSFLVKHVVLWPARFIEAKGFTITPERYAESFLAVFKNIEQHGTRPVVGQWPGYLLACVQNYWKKNWERYYEESKSVRNIVETFVAMGHRAPQPDNRTVEALAAAYKILSHKKPQEPKTKDKQLKLL